MLLRDPTLETELRLLDGVCQWSRLTHRYDSSVGQLAFHWFPARDAGGFKVQRTASGISSHGTLTACGKHHWQRGNWLDDVIEAGHELGRHFEPLFCPECAYEWRSR